MKKTKALSVFLAALLALSCTSCGNSGDSKSESESKAEASTQSDESEGDETDEDTTEEDTEEEPTEAETEEPEQETAENEEPAADELSVLNYFTPDTPNPPMWKVTDPATGNTLYMMGTIHVSCENTFPLPDYIMDVYEQSSGIAVEYDINALQSDYAQLMEFTQAFMLTDGTTVADHISEESYEAAKTYLSDNGMYSPTFDYFTPSYWVTLITSGMMLQLSDLSSDGVDAYFLGLAAEDGKEIVSIEQLQAQIDALNSYNDELSDYLIAEYFSSDYDLADVAEELGMLYNYWAVGDVDAMAEIDEEDTEEGMPEELAEAYEESQQKLLTERNKVMADRAADFLTNGDDLLFMVGYLHYAGDEGVDDLLEDMGYTVEKIA